VSVKLNGTRQPLIYADDVNLCDNVDTIKENTHTHTHTHSKMALVRRLV
jgi:hypothetical protein